MPDRHPADRLIVLTVWGKPGPVHNVAGDLRPLAVGEDAVLRGGADRAMPHRVFVAAPAQCGVWLLEQPGQVAEVAAPVLAERGFQLGRVAPAGHEVRISVCFAAAGPVQVVQQPSDPAAAGADLADHWRSCLRSSSAAWSSRWTRRRLSAAYDSRSPECWPVAFSLATAG